MTPGQAYYLDMVQAEAWQEPGASWAGTVPPAHTYAYEAEGDFPEELKHRLKGVQACIWSEHFLSRGYFNRLVFPRLPAIAEAAWTPKSEKNWLRFAAIVGSARNYELRTVRKTMRIAVGGIHTECSTYSPGPDDSRGFPRPARRRSARR